MPDRVSVPRVWPVGFVHHDHAPSASRVPGKWLTAFTWACCLHIRLHMQSHVSAVMPAQTAWSVGNGHENEQLHAQACRTHPCANTGCGPQAWAGLDVEISHCGSLQRTTLTKRHNASCFILHVQAVQEQMEREECYRYIAGHTDPCGQAA